MATKKSKPARVTRATVVDRDRREPVKVKVAKEKPPTASEMIRAGSELRRFV